MKKVLTIFSAVLLLGGSLIGCNDQGGSKKPLTPSEKVMNTFVSKIKDGGYTIDSEKATFSVYSKDLMMVKYASSVEGAKDFGSMSIYNKEFKMYETFQVNLENSGDIFDYVVFKDKGRMIDVQSNQLLNYWITATKGNIWAAWKSTQDPLVYKTSEMVVRKSIGVFFTMGTSELGSINDMTLTFTDDTISEAHLTFTYNEGTPEIKNGDIHITLGGQVDYDQRIVDWMNDDDRNYPDPISKGWNSTFQTVIFFELHTANVKYAPVVPFGSYAAIPVTDHLNELDGYARIHDYHAKKSNIQDYAKVLLENGFTPFEGKGENWYSHHMRTKADDPAFMAYSLININYDDGLNIDIYGYYNRQIISSFDELNSIITTRSFPAFEESDAITSFNGFNSPFEGTEGLSYFENFETDGLYYFYYEDSAAIDQYISDYEAQLVEAGFEKDQTVTTNSHYERLTTEGLARILIYPKDGKMVHMKISYESYINPYLGTHTINSLGFPEVTTDNITYITDITRYTNLTSSAGNWDLYYKFSYTFESADAAEQAFNDYDAAVKASGNYKKGTAARKMTYDSLDGKQSIQGDLVGNVINFWFGARY